MFIEWGSRCCIQTVAAYRSMTTQFSLILNGGTEWKLPLFDICLLCQVKTSSILGLRIGLMKAHFFRNSDSFNADFPGVRHPHFPSVILDLSAQGWSDLLFLLLLDSHFSDSCEAHSTEILCGSYHQGFCRFPALAFPLVLEIFQALQICFLLFFVVVNIHLQGDYSNIILLSLTVWSHHAVHYWGMLIFLTMRDLAFRFCIPCCPASIDHLLVAGLLAGYTFLHSLAIILSPDSSTRYPGRAISFIQSLFKPLRIMPAHSYLVLS